MSTTLDVLGVGNAIVDVLSRAEDDALARAGLHKGAMQLIDEARADALYADMGPTTIVSGGSAANTMAGLASLGGASPSSARSRRMTRGASSRMTSARPASLSRRPPPKTAPPPRVASSS